MTKLYSRSPDVLWRNAGDRVLLRSLRGDGLITIDGSGTLMWELLARPITLDEMVAAMSSRYGVEPKLVREPVGQALADLEGAHLVESRDGGEANGASLSAQVMRAAQ